MGGTPPPPLRTKFSANRGLRIWGVLPPPLYGQNPQSSIWSSPLARVLISWSFPRWKQLFGCLTLTKMATSAGKSSNRSVEMYLKIFNIKHQARKKGEWIFSVNRWERTRRWARSRPCGYFRVVIRSIKRNQNKSDQNRPNCLKKNQTKSNLKTEFVNAWGCKLAIFIFNSKLSWDSHPVEHFSSSTPVHFWQTFRIIQSSRTSSSAHLFQEQPVKITKVVSDREG